MKGQFTIFSSFVWVDFPTTHKPQLTRLITGHTTKKAGHEVPYFLVKILMYG